MTRGKLGEDIALEFLTKKGYKLIERNYYSRFGEIDIIMKNDRYIIFVEVKLRKNNKYGTPAEFVTAKKQQKIIITAEDWLLKNKTELQPRFDVIEIYMPKDNKVSINHIENAFDA